MVNVKSTMNPSDWITEDEINQAKVEAKEIWENFCNDLEACDGEQSWTEIKINDKFFDIECYDPECDRTGLKQEMYCNLYPAIPTVNGWRETDGTRGIKLFSKGEEEENE
tara:strand:- start:637 stop:966 length:330 start_codon:yes stop_codon:yes gene_type:complete